MISTKKLLHAFRSEKSIKYLVTALDDENDEEEARRLADALGDATIKIAITAVFGSGNEFDDDKVGSALSNLANIKHSDHCSAINTKLKSILAANDLTSNLPQSNYGGEFYRETFDSGSARCSSGETTQFTEHSY